MGEASFGSQRPVVMAVFGRVIESEHEVHMSNSCKVL